MPQNLSGKGEITIKRQKKTVIQTLVEAKTLKRKRYKEKQFCDIQIIVEYKCAAKCTQLCAVHKK